MGYKKPFSRDPISGLHVHSDIESGEFTHAELRARNESRQEELNRRIKADWAQEQSPSLTDSQRKSIDTVGTGKREPGVPRNLDSIGQPSSLTRNTSPRGYSAEHPEVGLPTFGNALSRMPSPSTVGGRNQHYGSSDQNDQQPRPSHGTKEQIESTQRPAGPKGSLSRA